MSRIFLGLPISKEIYNQLKQAVTPYQNLSSHGHWILPENTHITIRFFGDIDRNTIPALWNSLQTKISRSVLPILVSIKKIGKFPENKSTLIAAHVAVTDQIKQLYLLTNEISVDSTAKNQKNFLPHITIYRGKDKTAFEFPDITMTNCEFEINTLTLYESKVVDGQRCYQALYTMRLG